MIEWIVILTWIATPLNGFNKAIIGDRLDRVYISSNTQTFSRQWNDLTREEREHATVIKGQKFNVLPELKLIREGMTFDEIADLAEKETAKKLNVSSPLVKVGYLYRLKKPDGSKGKIVRVTDEYNRGWFFGVTLIGDKVVNFCIDDIVEEDLLREFK